MERIIKICSNGNFISRGQARRYLAQLNGQGYTKVIFDCADASNNNKAYIFYLKDEIKNHYQNLDFEIELINV